MQSKNKTAIITGAGQGIGLCIALRFAKEGYNIVVSDIEQKNCEKVVKRIKKIGGVALAVACDVSKKNQVDNLITQAIKKFGKLDILVNKNI